MSDFFKNKRIVITGGAGFLGGYIIEGLQKRGCQNILIPKIEDYNFVNLADRVRMYDDMKPDIVIHLAAVVGGIGANRQHPGKFCCVKQRPIFITFSVIFTRLCIQMNIKKQSDND